ncbi:MAG: bifunctional phosphopantothenoylcysteine decarboxylase/phosphopantothenate--cysteine ligase CoaBC [Bacteroidales bacterium]|nr:bifunctional phosphopantothenoylcysteine decarboxylase/phosphopantothenate--cysteine ligase CoaBC [Bacteroidales bacterium]
MNLAGKKIIIGITASIAAYKVPILIRLFKKAGAEVQVILTPAAHDFVTPVTMSTLSERPVLTEFFNKRDGSWSSHIDLGMWADLILVAPVSANTLAKMASGIADNLLLTTLLSARCPVFFAPAMDLDMFKHPTTIENIKTLESYGYTQIKPVEGDLASGLKGCGRMEEPEIISEIIDDFFFASKVLNGKNVLITAGPTHESIDPVRFIGNHSSGKMGYALSQVMADMGAHVELVSGPSNEVISHRNINITKVTSANDMYAACLKYFPTSEITIMSAAVADFTPEQVPNEKIKKSNKLVNISLKPTVDIISSLTKKKKNNQIIVGFALETNDAEENAIKKLNNKNLDLVVLNTLEEEGVGFGHDTNKVTIFNKNGEKVETDLKSKIDIAQDIASEIIKYSNF